MTTREYFDRKLAELRDDILLMGSQVEEELKAALDAYKRLDLELAKQVYLLDAEVNRARFDIEEKCFTLIVTQQPAARDLRAIVSAMSVIVDLERMGDQAKGIAKLVPRLLHNPGSPRPVELTLMGEIVQRMIEQVMLAYSHGNTDLAKMVAEQDDEVDALYGRVFTQIMAQIAAETSSEGVETAYELLRVARELERFGDLATNIAERSIYLVTGTFTRPNVDRGADLNAN